MYSFLSFILVAHKMKSYLYINPNRYFLKLRDSCYGKVWKTTIPPKRFWP